MQGLMIAAFVLIFVCGALSTLFGLIDDFIYEHSAFFSFIGRNVDLVCGIGFIIAAILVARYLKPHPAERYFESYKRGQITRRQAIEGIATTMYNPIREGIPPAYESKIIEKRIQALRKRVRAETGFMSDLIDYMKTKARLE